MKNRAWIPLLIAIAILNFIPHIAVDIIVLIIAVVMGWVLSGRELPSVSISKEGNSNELERSSVAADAEQYASKETSAAESNVLTSSYINGEWKDFEETISSVLENILHVVQERFNPHTTAIFLPTANGSFQMKAHFTKSDCFVANAKIVPGEGFLGTYCKDGFPELILDDVGGRTLNHYSAKNGGVSSLMLAPVSAVKASAFIYVDAEEKGVFSDDDVKWLIEIGKVAGQLLYYSYLYKQYHLLHAQVNAISLLEKRLLMIENRNELLDELCTNITDLFPFTRCTISLVDDEHEKHKQACVERVIGEPDGLVQGDMYSLTQGSLATMTFMNQQPFARNFNQTSDYIFDVRESRKGYASFASVPVGRSYGIIFLESDQPNTYTAPIMDTLSRIVMVAGVALDKIRVLEQQENLAIRDGLTGLYNHRQFQHMLREAIARSHRLMLKSVSSENAEGEPHFERQEEKRALSLVLCDIDHFKLLNDNHGHRFGDQVLREIAETLESGVREGVDSASRYGGEEFTLVLDSNGAMARETANRIREKIASIPFQTPSGSTISVTMSFGIAVYDKDATRQEDLIQKADKALYRAKEKGRNRVEMYGE